MTKKPVKKIPGQIKKISKPPVFKEKPITEAPPDTFPKEPTSHIGKCMHSNKTFVKGKAGYNCNDCGFFISIASIRHNPVKKVEKKTVFHEPKKLDTPQISEINFIEIPRGVFDLSGEGVLKENLGEKDKEKLITLKSLLGTYQIESVNVVNNNFLFFLKK